MKTKTIPAIIMLLAGFIACISGIMSHMDIADFMKMLLLVLVIFYVIGCVAMFVLDMMINPKKPKDDKDEDQDKGEAQDGDNAGTEAGEQTKEASEDTAKDNK
jgi:flagellar biosynthesis/type III secretory pathway M-ring protein FliF/YscJ